MRPFTFGAHKGRELKDIPVRRRSKAQKVRCLLSLAGFTALTVCTAGAGLLGLGMLSGAMCCSARRMRRGTGVRPT
jgi:hypothetical protein